MTQYALLFSQINAIRAELQQLESYDTLHVVTRQQTNQRLKRDLDECRNGHHPNPPSTQPPQGKAKNYSKTRTFKGLV